MKSIAASIKLVYSSSYTDWCYLILDLVVSFDTPAYLTDTLLFDRTVHAATRWIGGLLKGADNDAISD